MKLLLIEDEELLAKPLISALENSGYAVDYSNNGKDGLSTAEINSYDCILLDLNLPLIDGITIAKKLREHKNNTPILMVTARHRLDEKLTGFDAGTDDYISKPFNLKELLARVNALVRRASANKNHTLGFQNFELKYDQNVLIDKRTNNTYPLTNKETNILEYLIRNINRTVSPEDLLEHVWNEEANPFSNTVKTHIKTLRQKFDRDKKILITVHGKGYMLKDPNEIL